MVLYRGSIFTVRGRIISPSTLTASLVKPTHDVETLLSQSVSSRIQRKLSKIKHPLNFHYLSRFFYIIICYCRRDDDSVIIWGLYSPNIFIQKRDYIIESLLSSRLFFGSCPPISQSSENHVDDSHHWSVVVHFLRLRLKLSIGRRLSRTFPSKLGEIVSSNQGFYLILELNILFDIMTMITM